MKTFRPVQPAIEQLIVIDGRIDRQHLPLDSNPDQTRVLILDRDRDGIEAIAQTLQTYHNLRAIHLIVHGRPGGLQLGATNLNRDSLSQYAATLRQWSQALSSQAEILVYGCRTGAGSVGREFLQALHQLTGASIAASSAIVGRGCWHFDRILGRLTTPLPFSSHTLATYPGTFTLANPLYATGGNRDEELFEVDLETGALTRVANLFTSPAPGYPPTVTRPNGRVVDLTGTFTLSRRSNPSDPNDPGLLYYFDRGIGQANLYSYNPVTGAITTYEQPVSFPGETAALLKMAQDQAGNLYVVGGTTKLYQIDPDVDPATEAPNIVRTLDVAGDGFQGASGDIAFDPNNANTLYVTLTPSDPDDFQLYTVDVSSGTATFIGQVVDEDGNTLDRNDGGALAFGADGNLYLTSRTGSTLGIFRVNPSTARATLVTSTSTSITDFGTLPVPAPQLDINLEKDDGQPGTGNVEAGGELQYTLTIDNTSSIDATGLEVSDPISSDLTDVTWTLTVFDSSDAEVASLAKSGTGNINETLDLPGGHRAVYIINTQVSDSPSSDSITNQFTVRPPSGFALLDESGNPVLTLTAEDTVNINNQPPAAQNDTITTPPGQNTPVTGLLGIDPEGDSIQSYTIDSLPSGGKLFLNDVEVTAGQEIPAADIGKLEFRAEAGFEGSSFTYTAKDVKGSESTPGTITLNNPPTAAGDTITVPPGNDTALVPTPLSGGDSDGSVSGYRITKLPDPADGVLYLGDPNSGGVPITSDRILTPDERDRIVFQGKDGFDGGNFEFITLDNQGAESPPATVNLNVGNAPPETTDNIVREVPPGSPVALTGLGGSDDITANADLDYKITELPDNGSLTLNGNPVTLGQTLTASQLANLQFSFPDGFEGSTRFQYAAIDADGQQDPTPGSVYLKSSASTNIPPETDDSTTAVPPNTSGSSATVTPGVATRITGLGGQDPDGSIAEYRITQPPSNATLYLGDPASGGQVIEAGDTIPPGRLGELFVVPEPGFSGGNFQYAAVDDSGEADPTPATVTLTSGNNVPETQNVRRGLPNPNEVLKLDGLGGSDADGSVAFYRIDTLPSPSSGVLYLGHPDAGGVPVQAGTQLTPDQLSRLHFQAGDSPTSTSFTYSAIDNLGAVDPTPGTVNLSDSSQPPETNDVSQRFDSGDTQVPLSGLGGSDEDGTVAFFTIKSLPAASAGVLYLGDPADNVRVSAGQRLSAEQLNQLVFVPEAGFFGETSFTYAATDNTLLEDPTPATVTLSNIPLPEPTPPDLDDLLGIGQDGDGSDGENPQAPDSDIVDSCCPPVPEAEPIPEVASIPGLTPLSPVPWQPLDTTGFDRPTVNRLEGSDGNDIITSGATSDELQGRGGNDEIQGFEGDDFIQGGLPDDLDDSEDRDALAGNQGNDLIAGNQGSDTIFAGRDNDLVLGGKGNDRIWGDLGDDTLDGELGDDAIAGDELLAVAEGGNDWIYGNSGNDSLNGNSGNDTIAGGEGDDIVGGGKDNDLVYGQAGNDFVQGHFGDDTIIGSDEEGTPADERDVLHGNPGRDVVFGGVGDDTLHGGKDADWLDSGRGNDLVFGDRGPDTIDGNSGDDTIAGRSLNPEEPEENGSDLIYGGDGNDFIQGNENNDTIAAGNGEDVVLGGKDNDLVEGNLGADTLKGEFGNDTLVGSPTEAVEGISEDDVLSGNDGDDLILAGVGDDLVYAGKNNDLVDAGEGNDRVYGDLGNDTLHGQTGDDTLAGGNGNPILGDDIDADLVFGDDGDDFLLGNGGDDSLVGGEGDDVAVGGRDDDLLWGEAGNDLLVGDRGSDTLCGDSGDDTLLGGNSDTNRQEDGDDLLCAGEGNDLLAGNEGNDTLFGGDGDDTLFGGDGDDTLMGGDGNDLLSGDRGSDTLVGGAGQDGFVLTTNAENNLVRDFSSAEDALVLVGGLSREQLEFVGDAGNTLIRLGDRTLATLVGISPTTLTENNFR